MRKNAHPHPDGVIEMSVNKDNPQIPFAIGETLRAPGKKIPSTRRAARLVTDYIGYQDQEYAIVITTDCEFNVLGIRIVGIGSAYETITCVRDIMRGAIVDGAHGIVFIHNHPSGQMHASKADKKMAHVLKKAGDLLDIVFHDSIIVHKRKWTSVL